MMPMASDEKKKTMNRGISDSMRFCIGSMPVADGFICWLSHMLAP